MDAIVSILPQIQSANSAGNAAAPDPAEAGLFASLLAGQTAPVAPVPAIPSRQNGGNFLPSAAAAGAAPVLTALAQGAAPAGIASGVLMATGDPALTSSTPASPATGAQIDGQAATPAPGTGPAASGAALLPSDPAINDKSASALTSQPAAATPESGAGTAVSGKTGTVPQNPANGATLPLPEGGAKSAMETAIKTNMALAPNGVADSAPKAAETVSMIPVADSARSLSANPALQSAGGAATAANTPAAVSAAASALQMPVEAGVQARRDASGANKMQPAVTGLAAKSTMQTGSKAATSATSASASTVKPDMAAPVPQAAQSLTAPPPAADLPAEAARMAMGDAARTPIPVDVTQSDPDAEAERADLSNLRAADASRTAERPGSAAGSARFTPATAGTLAAQIAAKFQNGERRFEIRMDPPELGKVEVKLHVGNDNRVQAMLSAERPETLNDLRQYARELERALEEAGLQLENDSLSFELSQGEEDQDQTPQGSGRFSRLEFAEDLAGSVTAAAPPQELYGFRLSARSGVDIRL